MSWTQTAMVAIYVGGFCLLIVIVGLLVAHIIYIRRVDRQRMLMDDQLLAAKRQEVELIRAQSVAIGWLVDNAKHDIHKEGEQTRREQSAQTAAQTEELKAKIDESIRTANG